MYYSYEDEELSEQQQNIQRDAVAVIADKVATIWELVRECQDLAKESGVDFELDLGQSNYFDGRMGRWQSSSSNC